jgi:hypothetical protein
MNMNTTLVTAFFDIGRSSWKEYVRTPEEYIESFFHLLRFDCPIILFIDKKYHTLILQHIQQTSALSSLFQIVPIDLEWLLTHTSAWKNHYTSFQTIMQSNEYQRQMQHRIKNNTPETLYPEYNLINHSKVDFIDFSLHHQWIKTPWTAWIDFGYAHAIYGKTLDSPFKAETLSRCISSCFSHKMNFWACQLPQSFDADALWTCTHDRVTITGSFYVGKTELWSRFILLYHACLKELVEQHICDDDQHVLLRCFLKHPSEFFLFLKRPHEVWPKAL